MSKKLYEYKLNRENPFILETVHHIEKGEKKIFMGNKEDDIMVNRNTGVIQAHSVFVKKIETDQAQFAKIFLSNVSSFFELSKSGLKIFTYVLQSLKPNKDSFMFSYDDCKNHTGYKSKKSITDGLKELIENKFIARGENPYIYFINPTIFFNGNRITFMKSYEVKNQKDELDSPANEILKIESL